MRSTIVPAQITTVEDKITNRLGLSQLLLLTLPIFGGSAIFVILPPFFSYALYKVVLITVVAFLCALLAIRIKGRILLFWLMAIVKYNIRPRYYVYNKNSLHKRERTQALKSENEEQQAVQRDIQELPLYPQISTAELVRIENIMSNPQTEFQLVRNKRGGLSVRYRKI